MNIEEQPLSDVVLEQLARQALSWPEPKRVEDDFSTAVFIARELAKAVLLNAGRALP